MKNNKKGFTLIELLAVIVILAILIAVAVPAVTRYLNTARANSMRNEAATLIDATRTALTSSNVTGAQTITIANGSKDIVCTGCGTAFSGTGVLEKALSNSPYGKAYQTAVIKVDASNSYSICLTDGTTSLSAAEGSLQTEDFGKLATCPTT